MENENENENTARQNYVDKYFKDNKSLHELWIETLSLLPKGPINFTDLPLQKYVHHQAVDLNLLNTKKKEDEMVSKGLYTIYPKGKIFKCENTLNNSIKYLSFSEITKYIKKKLIVPVLSYSPEPFNVIFISFILTDESVRDIINFGQTSHYYKSDDDVVVYPFLEEDGLPRTTGSKNDNHFIWARNTDNILHCDNPEYIDGFRPSMEKYDIFFNKNMPNYIQSDGYIVRNITLSEFNKIQKFVAVDSTILSFEKKSPSEIEDNILNLQNHFESIHSTLLKLIVIMARVESKLNDKNIE